MRTAADEHFGGSVDASMAGGFYQVGLPFGPGGARYYVLRPSGATFVILPLAAFIRPGADVFEIVNAGSADLAVYTLFLTPVVTVTPGQTARLHLLESQAVADGVWQCDLAAGTVTLGTSLADRKPVELRLTAQNNVDLRNQARAVGAVDDVPYALTCTVAAGEVIGSTSTSAPAMDTGIWPAGSTIKLIIEAGARICGRGGAGGRGGMIPPTSFNEAGNTGGTALQVQCPTVLTSFGYIQGGGGGGGGGTFLGVPGGGGGGGAGYSASVGGAGGINPISGAQLTLAAGQPGSVGIGGLGGVSPGGNNGGAGGGPGAAGSPGLSGASAITPAAGGAAGSAIRRATASTLTKLVAGTIDGAEVTF